jgi:hypothetical protein
LFYLQVDMVVMEADMVVVMEVKNFAEYRRTLGEEQP